MKTKLITLITLLLTVCSGAWASDVYKFQLNGNNVEYINGTKSDTPTYFSWNSNKHNFNAKFNGCTYDGVTYTSGLKMESATNVSWTSTAEATVTIVQSTWSTNNTIKFDGTELAIANANTSTAGAYIFTLTEVAAGSHSVTRGSGENGIFAITVEYTGTVLTQLDTPEITATGAGAVTIGSVSNATKVTYTTDGTDPTAESTAYTTSFNVEDGTTVKAIAIGDGTSYTNSTIATMVVYHSGITCADPTFEVKNGTVAISSTTPLATIEYSTDGGETYTDYTIPLTFTTSTTVYARAKRDGATTSGVVSQVVNNAPVATTGSLSKIIYYNTTDMTAAASTPKGLTGKAGTDYEDWGVTLNSTSKDLSYGNSIDVDGSKTTLKGSNGIQLQITMPDGVTANRLTIYSYNNGTFSGTSLWSEVGGTAYSAETEIGLASTSASTPDVRIFPLSNVTGTLTITNNGVVQQCLIAVVDYTQPQVAVTGVSLNKSETSIEVGSTETLSATITPDNATNKAVTWTSSDTDVATVDGGVVTGVAAGSTTITVTTSDGSFTASCEVTVTAAATGVTAESDKFWNFDEVFSGISSASSGLVSGKNIEVITSSGTITVSSSKKTFGSTDISKCLAMGKVSDKSHQIHVKVAPKSLISIYSYGGSSGKYLTVAVASKDGDKLIDNVQISGSPTISTCAYTGDENGDLYIYNSGSSNGLNIYGIKVEPLPYVTLNNSGYGTFSYVSDVEIVGATAYKMALNLSANTLTGTAINAAIPAGEGVLLKGEAKAKVYIIETTGAATITGNNLHGTTDSNGDLVSIPSGKSIYVLSGDTFKKFTGDAFTANKAYFEVNGTTVEGRVFSMVFDDGTTTGINSIDNGQSTNGNVYNLNGQRVAQPAKGLYIVNGKKVIIK